MPMSATAATVLVEIADGVSATNLSSSIFPIGPPALSPQLLQRPPEKFPFVEIIVPATLVPNFSAMADRFFCFVKPRNDTGKDWQIALNAMMGEKLAIVNRIPDTTDSYQIPTVCSRPACTRWSKLSQFDASRNAGIEETILNELKKAAQPVILVIKIDRYPTPHYQLLPTIRKSSLLSKSCQCPQRRATECPNCTNLRSPLLSPRPTQRPTGTFLCLRNDTGKDFPPNQSGDSLRLQRRS